jgi:transcriptional regulator with XRE-family HTH domain
MTRDRKTTDFPMLVALTIEDLTSSGVEHPQSVLAEKIGVTQATISRWLAGRRLPRRVLWDAIAEAVGVERAALGEAIAMTVLVPETQSEALRRRIAELEEEVRMLNDRLRHRPRSGRE